MSNHTETDESSPNSGYVLNGENLHQQINFDYSEWPTENENNNFPLQNYVNNYNPYPCSSLAPTKTPPNSTQNSTPINESVNSSLVSLQSVQSDISSIHDLSQQHESRLKKFLEQTCGGRMIILSYKKFGFLTDYFRNSLVHLIIQKQIDDMLQKLSDKETSLSEYNIPAAELKRIAAEIIELFPNEDETLYYVPHQTTYTEKSEKIVVRTSGKLVDHSAYMRKILLQEKILIPIQKKKGVDSSPTQRTSTETISQCETESHDWLKAGHIEPREDVLIKWDLSYNIRKKYIFDENPMNFLTYISNYECFMTYAVELINQDFGKLFPQKGHLFYEAWPHVRLRLLEKVIRANGKDRNFSSYILSKTEGKQDCIIISSLPKVLPVPAIKRSKKESESASTKVVRPSTFEVQESFTLLVDNSADVDAKIVEAVNSHKERKETLQPILLFANPDADFDVFYIIIDGKKIQLPSVKEALDLAFKSFFTFNLKYPARAYHIWQLVQQAFYGIKEAREQTGMGTKALVSELKSILPEDLRKQL